MEQERFPQKITDPKVALVKAEQYCAYQERAQHEVRNKLYEWGLWPDVIEQTIATLIENNFLNEERFARSYTQSKFNQKSWGRIKIKQGLKLKKVPDKLIRKALNEINSDDYLSRLKKIIEKKEALLKESDNRKKQYKLQQYALQHGFENDLILFILKNNELENT